MRTKVSEPCISSNKATKKNSSHTSLDTLEITSDLFLSKNHERLYKWATHKKLNQQTFTALIDVADPKQQKQYWKSWWCNSVLLQNETVLKGSLCRKRWCQHCNRIKTAELIKGYHAPLVEMDNKDSMYFVTLTAPTVSARKLNSEIDKRNKAFSRIKDNLRKNYNIKLNGIRKLEVTYTNERKFHPHFHLLIQGKESAYKLLQLWLSYYSRRELSSKDMAKRSGQHIRLADGIKIEGKNGLLETFKYTVKPEVKDVTHAKAYNHIYKCLERRRTIQTFGSIRKVKEPKEAKTERMNCDWIEPRFEIWHFDSQKADLTNAYDETLIGTEYINSHIKET